MQTVPGRHTPASELLRDGAAALGWRHDEIPRWMTYPHGTDAASGERQSMTRTYLPRAHRGRGTDARRASRRPVGRRPRTRRSGPSSPGPTAARARSTSSTSWCAPARSRRRPCCNDPATAGWSAEASPCIPTVKLAARFDEPVNVVDDVPVHQVKEFAPDLSFGGSASQPGLVALALTDHWSLMREAVTAWREIAVYYAAITSEGRGRVHAVPGLRDPLVTYRLTRRDRPLLGQGLARLALVMLAAGAERGLSVVPRRSDRAQSRRSGRRHRCLRQHGCGERDDGASVLDGADGRGPSTSPPPTASDACTAPTTCTSTTPRCSRTRPASTHRRR